MTKWVCLFALISAPLLGRGQEVEVSLSDLVNGAQAWAEENLDTNVLAVLKDVDQQKAQRVFRELQRQFQGEYVVDLASVRESALLLLPILQAHPETQPYAAWLRPRMVYLEVADELRLSVPPPSTGVSNAPVPIPNPPAEQEREIWVKKVSTIPWPMAAKEYVPKLKPVFAAQQVPSELVWLAEVESAFDARAVSPMGAAGMFQLMPETAKRFGLSLWPRDQRYQPEPSASASAQYLKYLHDRFKDWRLALAAYNAGEGTVQRLLDKYKAQSYDEIAVRLPAETQLYVPKVEATVLRREGMKLGDLGKG